MAFSPRKNPFDDGGGHGDGHGELMITPLLDLFVALIPFLIMSVVLVKINVVDVAVSKPVAVLQKKQDNFILHLKVGIDSASLSLNSRPIDTFKVGTDGKWLGDLHSGLVRIKKNHLDLMEIRIEATSPKVNLDLLMSAMDAARLLKDGDGVMTRPDESSGKRVRVKYLFPKVILKGVYS